MDKFNLQGPPIVLHPAHAFMVRGFFLAEKPLWETTPYWQHRKHDPSQGNFHQYRLLGMTTPATSEEKHGAGVYLVHGPQVFHTEDEKLVSVCRGAGTPPYLYDPLENRWYTLPHAIYQSLSQPDKVYARPWDLFMDGRFTKITPEQVDVLMSSHQLS